MNPYMIYSKPRSEEGAFLVFAHNWKEARKAGYFHVMFLIGADYTDVAVRRLRNADWLFEEANKTKLENDEAHVIDNPKYCKDCNMWGQSRIGDDQLCDDCRYYREEDSIAMPESAI